MHILRRQSCQRFVTTLLAGLALAGLFLHRANRAVAQNAASGPAAPSPPPWQRDLAAAHLLRAAAALGPSRDPAVQQTRQARLAQLYRDLAAKYPGQIAVQRAAGDYFDAIGSRDLAVRYWQAAGALDLKDASTAAALGGAALARGDVREAANQFQRAVDDRPGEAGYHFDLANVLYLFRHDLADPPGAAGSDAEMVRSLGQFRLAAELAPRDAGLAQAYAETFYMLDKPDWAGALAAWEKVRLLDAPNTDFANAHLARVSLRGGHPDAADKYLDAIQSPGFADMKAKLRAQAVKLRQQQQAPAAPGTR